MRDSNFSVKSGPNHDCSQMVIGKILQTEISCRYSHQTHSRSSHRQFKEVLRGQFATANVRTEQPREGRDRHCFQLRYMPLPGRQTIPTCLPKSMVIAVPTHAPQQPQNQTHSSSKKRMLPRKAASSDELLGSVLVHF